jgi:hypothetical protein
MGLVVGVELRDFLAESIDLARNPAHQSLQHCVHNVCRSMKRKVGKRKIGSPAGVTLKRLDDKTNDMLVNTLFVEFIADLPS